MIAAVFAVLGDGAVITGEGRPAKKNECMFEKKLGKRVKTRYYYTINS